MRARIIAPVAIAAALFVGGAIVLRRSAASMLTTQTQTQAGAAGATALVTADSRPARHTAKSAFTPLHRESAGVSSQPDDDGEIHESFEYVASIDERIGILEELSRSRNPSDLTSILIDLKNPEPIIRRAAVRAAVDFGSPEAVPELQNELAAADDPEEKTSLQRAIEFLQLPPATPHGQ